MNSCVAVGVLNIGRKSGDLGQHFKISGIHRYVSLRSMVRAEKDGGLCSQQVNGHEGVSILGDPKNGW